MNDKFLQLEVIWKDDEMIELQITSNNGRYSGKTEVYDTQHSLLKFAKKIKGYPIDDEELSYVCGKKDSYAYFEARFYKIDLSGIVGVQIILEENVPTDYRKEEKDKLTMELIVEPNSIDRFQKELLKLAENEEGKAKLIGIAQYTNNIN